MPNYSFVIPVWHEQETVPALIRRIREIDVRSRCEVVVVDGDPAGSTLHAIDDPRVVKLTASKGRAHQMNAGAAVARGGVIIFLHADTLPPRSALSDIDQILATGARCGAFRVRFDSSRPIYRFMSWFVSTYARLSRLPYGDQAIFVTREYFRRIEGYKPYPVFEDVELVRRIRRSGERLVIAPSSVRTSCRRMETEGIARCVARNWCIKTLYHLGISPHRLSRWYTDKHRVLETTQEAREGEPVVLARPGDST